MVLGRKTNFFLGKTKKPSFWSLWPHSFPKDVFFVVFLVFPRKRLVFSAQNHLFPRKKLVFLSKTIFFLGKSWFSCPKPSFPYEKVGFPVQNHFFPRENQTTIFLVSDRIVSQKMFFLVFLVFPRKNLVFLPKTIFFLGKRHFS